MVEEKKEMIEMQLKEIEYRIIHIQKELNSIKTLKNNIRKLNK